MTAHLHLRLAGEGDARLLFDWVNQADSLAAKLATLSPVSWPDHQAWFGKRLSAADCAIWIAERSEGPVGQVRAERNRDGRLHVDIFVAARARRDGVGAAMLAALAAESAARWPGEPLVARIRSDNAPSRHFFETNGYRLAETNADHSVFIRASQA